MTQFNASQQRGHVSVNYLDDVFTALSAIKRESYRHLQLKAGDRVLDLGCGTGVDVLELTKIVGQSGKVFGLDRDPSMIVEAKMRAKCAGLEDVTEYLVGEAQNLPCRACSFNAVRVDRVLMHVQDELRIIREIKRILKPGGQLVLTEPDWSTLSMLPSNVETERTIMRIHAESVLVNGYVARRLLGHLRCEGFNSVCMEISLVAESSYERVKQILPLDKVEDYAIQNGLLGNQAIKEWQEELVNSEKNQKFLATVNLLTVMGAK